MHGAVEVAESVQIAAEKPIIEAAGVPIVTVEDQTGTVEAWEMRGWVH